MRKILLTSLLISSLAMPVYAEVIATYSGGKVTTDDLEAFINQAMKANGNQGEKPDLAKMNKEQKELLARQVVSQKLLEKEAIKAGFDKTSEVEEILKNMRKQIAIQKYLETMIKSKITENDINKAYKEFSQTFNNMVELKAKHILVDSESTIKNIDEKLKKGQSFETLAKEFSKDTGSNAKGGDLGYFRKDQMVPEFGDAVDKLKIGEISSPVKTDFGWHIIKLEDRRKAKAPPLSEVRQQMENMLTGKALGGFFEELLKKAEFQVK